MCDTVCKRRENVTYFLKNSDREPEEAQFVEYYPHGFVKDKIKATYLEVEYEGERNAIVISRPYWMWGPKWE